MRGRSILAGVSAALAAAVPAPAQAGQLFTSVGGYGEESVEYEVGRSGPPSVILVRSLGDGRLVLEDRSDQIEYRSPRSPVRCRLHARRHVAVCRERAPFALGSVKIKGGPHNDVLDARSLKASSVLLEGGPGNDTLLAPRHRPNHYSRTDLVGGRGRNVLVGGPGAAANYVGAPGPVRADLARGFGLAPGERDRLIGMSTILGSPNHRDDLAGPRRAGEIWAGVSGGTILARSAGTTVRFQQSPGASFHEHQPTAIRCLGFSRVVEAEPGDVLAGRCRVNDVTLHLPMAAPDSVVATIDGAAVVSSYEKHTVLTAGSVVMGEALALPGAQHVPVRLDAEGRRLLAQRHRLRVLVSEFLETPGYHDKSQLWSKFSTVLALPRR